MGDSDDDYDRRRRDKFRGERNEYRGERREGENRRREDWNESERGGRRDYREYRGTGRDRGYSPGRGHDMGPPQKRIRPDWHDNRRFLNSGGGDPGYGGGGGGFGPPHPNFEPNPHFGGPPGPPPRDLEMGPTQPPMMSFKAFLASQDDSITDEEAIQKFAEYKLEFKRQQLNEFFIGHKEEEWFKSKYHPEECVKRNDEQLSNLKRRMDVFTDFLEASRISSVRLHSDQVEHILKLLDAVVIRLEGGSDLDLTILEVEETKQEEETKPEPFVLGDDKEKKEKTKPAEPSDQNKLPAQPLKMTISSEQWELQKKAKEYLKKGSQLENKRKRDYDKSDSESDTQEEPPPPPPPGMESKGKSEKDGKNDTEGGRIKSEPLENGDGKIGEKDEKLHDTSREEGEEVDEKPKKEEGVEVKKEEPTKPRPLHKTASIFLRNLAPTITKMEVEAMCRRYSGFLRAAIADPQPERRWFRRGWVTFERSVNIKEICWNLNNIRLRDCELGAIVNRDLSRRVRTVNGITAHKQVVRADIKLAARIVQNLDSRYSLWSEGGHGKKQGDLSFVVVSKNPVLKNITDYLIEEASAEEEELLGKSGGDSEEGEEGEAGFGVEKDDELFKVLDRLLLYLRIVHSVDYYNHSEYPNEDEMPNRCGIIHARGIPPSSKVTSTEINDYIKGFENKINSFLQPLVKLSDEDAQKLGLKDPEAEVSKFIQANTQELAKDKWLCPLSGKKFKGPDFVRKHIFNKHAEKVEEVKKEVEYFNNYLRDPKRPQLPEHPSAKQLPRKDERREPMGYGGFHPPPGPPPYGGSGPFPPYRGGPPMGGYPPRGDGGFRGGIRGGFGRRFPVDQRSLVGYHDLDAPRDMELF